MADHSKSRFLRYYVLKLKSFLFSKNVLSFLVFLLFSALFWFFNALNKDREMSLEIPVVYRGMPEDILLEEDFPSDIRVKIKDLGVNLWSYVKDKPKAVLVRFDQMQNANGSLIVSNRQLINLVSEKLMPGTAILQIEPEQINVSYAKLDSKLIPVRINGQISLENQYMYCSPVTLHPAEIKVYGPSDILDTLQFISTKKLDLNDLSESLQEPIDLQPLKSLRYGVDQVDLSICVERFTEKSVFLPVQIQHVPDHLTVISFPAEVNAVFNIGVNKFNSFKQDDIQIVIDYNEVKEEKSEKTRLHIINNNPYISNIRIQPEEVEFLLQAL